MGIQITVNCDQCGYKAKVESQHDIPYWWAREIMEAVVNNETATQVILLCPECATSSAEQQLERMVAQRKVREEMKNVDTR